jgi:riboflavin kinase / FMN adenylyltransferase
MTFNFTEGEVLLIDKPYEWSSFDVVRKIRNKVKIKKLGHAGTLDPLATGLLIICTGKFTKKINEFQEQEKEYEGELVLGQTTPSFDLETAVDQTYDISGVNPTDLKKITAKFIGKNLQTPPIFSAIKVGGERLYKKARRGEEAEIPAKEVYIKEFELTEINLPKIKFRVVCSKGTYIRSLVRDFGIEAGSGAYMSALRRTRIGSFHVDKAHNLEEFISTYQKKKKGLMKVYHQVSEFKKLENAVVTIGSFDGVHKGHQKILKRLTELAKENKGESVVITFWPHPRKVLSPDTQDIKLLSSLDEKIALLNEYGVEHLLIIPFNKEFSELSPDAFIKTLLIDTIGTKKLIIGHDHRFGRDRAGDFDYLQNKSSVYGFEVEEISREDVKDIGVSSSIIRDSLSKGDIKTAAEYLGRPYEFTGKVEEGKKLGRTIGFPTANIESPEPQKLVPADGVYAVLIEIGKKNYKGMMNIGLRPTVNGQRRKIEVHIFHFNRDIYGQLIVVRFIQRLRDEIKFPDLEALKSQLNRDKYLSESILANH